MLQIPDSLSIVWHSLPASIGNAHVWGRLCVCVCAAKGMFKGICRSSP